MSWPVLVAAALVGYLCGSIPFAKLVLKRVAPQQVDKPVVFDTEDGQRAYEMNAVSGTAVRMVAGPRWGCITGILDVLKVALPTLAVRYALPESPYYLATAYFGLVGHNWSVFNRFRGGRGLSAITGGMLAIDPWFVVAYGVVSMAAGPLMRKSGMVYLAVVSTPLLFIGPWLWWRFGEPAFLLYGIATTVTYLMAMIPEVRQVRRMQREGLRPDGDRLAQITRMDLGALRRTEKESDL